jgi:cytochrome c553
MRSRVLARSIALFVSAAILAISLPLRTHASSAENPFKYSDLERLIRTERIRSIDTLLSKLPNDLLSRYVLMKSSRSLQEASATNPRAILFGNDARLILSFNGSAEQMGYNKLEVIQFHDATRSFELREIEFPETNGGPLGEAKFSQANPSSCLRCHGNDPRPNWEPYARWPGAYGENDGRIPRDTSHQTHDLLSDLKTPNIATQSDLAKFMGAAATHPRYRHLALLPIDKKDPEEWRIKAPQDFTAKLAQLNFMRVARLMQATPFYETYKFAILGGVLYQNISVLATEFSQYKFSDFFPKSLFNYHRSRQPKHDDDTAQYKVSYSENLDLVFEALGVDTREWSMDFLSNGELGVGGRYTTPGFSGFELASAIAESDPELQTYLGISSDRSVPGQFIEYFKKIYPHRKEFKQLAARSRKQFKESKDLMNVLRFLRPAEIPPLEPAFFPSISDPRMPQALMVCISCHSTGQRSVPAIPFTSSRSGLEDVLKTQVRSEKTNWLEKINTRLSDESMPPEGMDNTLRHRISEYLNGMSR